MPRKDRTLAQMRACGYPAPSLGQLSPGEIAILRELPPEGPKERGYFTRITGAQPMRFPADRWFKAWSLDGNGTMYAGGTLAQAKERARHRSGNSNCVNPVDPFLGCTVEILVGYVESLPCPDARMYYRNISEVFEGRPARKGKLQVVATYRKGHGRLVPAKVAA
jgi:hypothetical protein